MEIGSAERLNVSSVETIINLASLWEKEDSTKGYPLISINNVESNVRFVCNTYRRKFMASEIIINHSAQVETVRLILKHCAPDTSLTHGLNRLIAAVEKDHKI
jgi:hypothetical protein